MAQVGDTTAVAATSKLERAAFESTAIIESQSNVLNTKGTLELTMNHRFGIVNSGPQSNDFFGIWAPANIRLALNYAISNRLNVGFGTIKDNRLQEFSLKGAVLRQTRDGKMPFSVTYYGNAQMDGRPSSLFLHPTDRWSFYNQLIFARRFSRNLSLQIAPSFSHFNYVEAPVENDAIAVEFGGRVKITPTMAVLFDYNQPITTYFKDNTKPGMGAGIEFSTGSHAFQLFITNYKALSPQQSVVANKTDFFEGKYLIGFNITRLWHL
jgi:hypothetical protein